MQCSALLERFGLAMPLYLKAKPKPMLQQFDDFSSTSTSPEGPQEVKTEDGKFLGEVH